KLDRLVAVRNEDRMHLKLLETCTAVLQLLSLRLAGVRWGAGFVLLFVVTRLMANAVKNDMWRHSEAEKVVVSLLARFPTPSIPFVPEYDHTLSLASLRLHLVLLPPLPSPHSQAPRAPFDSAVHI
ncbi:unnamed protein product, partial [Ectocarpus sp. 4 AP-2014]